MESIVEAIEFHMNPYAKPDILFQFLQFKITLSTPKMTETMNSQLEPAESEKARLW